MKLLQETLLEYGLGDWLSRDPMGEDIGTNLYQYTWNNPLSWVDLFGLAPSLHRRLALPLPLRISGGTMDLVA